jgi:hypothetical protein
MFAVWLLITNYNTTFFCPSDKYSGRVGYNSDILSSKTNITVHAYVCPNFKDMKVTTEKLVLKENKIHTFILNNLQRHSIYRLILPRDVCKLLHTPQLQPLAITPHTRNPSFTLIKEAESIPKMSGHIHQTT